MPCTPLPLPNHSCPGALAPGASVLKSSSSDSSFPVMCYMSSSHFQFLTQSCSNSAHCHAIRDSVSHFQLMGCTPSHGLQSVEQAWCQLERLLVDWIVDNRYGSPGLVSLGSSHSKKSRLGRKEENWALFPLSLC